MEIFNYTTHTEKILADLYTPVAVYMRLRDIYPQSALMESSDYHGNDNSRSFIGIHPMANIQVAHGVIRSTYPDGTVDEKIIDTSVKGRAKEAVADAINDFIGFYKLLHQRKGPIHVINLHRA